jgi:hypothetical protein
MAIRQLARLGLILVALLVLFNGLHAVVMFHFTDGVTTAIWWTIAATVPPALVVVFAGQLAGRLFLARGDASVDLLDREPLAVLGFGMLGIGIALQAVVSLLGKLVTLATFLLVDSAAEGQSYLPFAYWATLIALALLAALGSGIYARAPALARALTT